MARRRRGYVTRQLSEKELRRLARGLADDQLAPARRGLVSDQSRFASQLTGLSGALGGELSSIGAQSDDAFNEGAERSAAYSSGYAATLDKLGSPGAGSVLAGLGAENAGRMARSGALLRARGAQLPGLSGLVAGERLAGSQESLRSALAELERTRPGLSRQIFQDLLGGEVTKEGLRLNAESLGLDALNSERDFAVDVAGLDADAAGDAADEKTKTQKARTDAWWKGRNGSLGLAKEMFARTREGGGLEGGEVPDRPSYGMAYGELWASFGQELVKRHGFSKRRVRKMLHTMLGQVGFVRPPEVGSVEHGYGGGN